MNYYEGINVDDVKAAALLMDLDIIAETQNNFGIGVHNEEFKEVLCQTFLNSIYYDCGDNDPLTWQSVPGLVKQVYKKLSLIEAQSLCWEQK